MHRKKYCIKQLSTNTTRYWLIHRADYHKCLYTRALELGVQIKLNSLVQSVDESAPSVTLANGEVISADVVVGADGIRSTVRESILGDEDVTITDSTNCAYRATVPNELMRQDAETAQLMDDVNANCWIGHERHIMAYPIRNGALYNLVMSHPGKASVGKWNEPGNLDEMKQHYADFDPVIKKVLSKVKNCLKWKLADLPPLLRWVSRSGRVVLIGDAAHAMVPYLAQGASLSIEDGAALAECVDHATDVTQIPAVLNAFAEIRKPRCETVQAGSRSNGDIWHMPDGPEQQKRDQDMLSTMSSTAINGAEKQRTQKPNPNRWSDETFQPWLFGYDTFTEVGSTICVFLLHMLTTPDQEAPQQNPAKVDIMLIFWCSHKRGTWQYIA